MSIESKDDLYWYNLVRKEAEEHWYSVTNNYNIHIGSSPIDYEDPETRFLEELFDTGILGFETRLYFENLRLTKR